MMAEEAFDPETGVIDAHRVDQRAADGGRLPPPAATLADTLRLLEDGDFDREVSAEMRALISKMEEHAANNKGVSKGQLTIVLDISAANGAHIVTPSFKVKAPVQKRQGTLLFAMDDGRLSRNPQGQGAFFGVREVTDQRGPARSV